jgi:hypothetical protein
VAYNAPYRAQSGTDRLRPAFFQRRCRIRVQKRSLGQGTQAQITISNWLFEDAAELIINGESAGSLAWDPYRWNVSLPQNVESAVLRVANTMLPAFEGAHFNLEAHQTVFVD